MNIKFTVIRIVYSRSAAHWTVCTVVYGTSFRLYRFIQCDEDVWNCAGEWQNGYFVCEHAMKCEYPKVEFYLMLLPRILSQSFPTFSSSFSFSVFFRLFSRCFILILLHHLFLIIIRLLFLLQRHCPYNEDENTFLSTFPIQNGILKLQF